MASTLLDPAACNSDPRSHHESHSLFICSINIKLFLDHGLILTARHLQATLSKLLPYSCQLSLLSSAGREMSGSLQATGRRPSVPDWGGGMSGSCKPRVQLFADAGNGWPHSALRYH